MCVCVYVCMYVCMYVCIYLFILHCSNERPMDAQMRYFGEVLLDNPGFGTRCMVDEPLE